MAANPTSSQKRSVKTVLINRPLQREFTLTLLAVMMTAAVAAGMVIHLTLSGLTENLPITVSRTTIERLIFDANSQLVVGVILILFFAVIATGFFGVFFLHRVAGPVFRFRQVLARMGRGEIPNDIQLRRRDFFKETADEINKVIYLLREFEKASHAAEDLLQDASQEKLSPKASSRIKEIHNVFAALKKPSS